MATCQKRTPCLVSRGDIEIFSDKNWPFFRQLPPFVEKNYEFRPIQDNLLRADDKS